MTPEEEQYGRGIAGREVALTAALPREECPYCQACPDVPCVLHRVADPICVCSHALSNHTKDSPLGPLCDLCKCAGFTEVSL